MRNFNHPMLDITKIMVAKPAEVPTRIRPVADLFSDSWRADRTGLWQNIWIVNWVHLQYHPAAATVPKMNRTERLPIRAAARRTKKRGRFELGIIMVKNQGSVAVQRSLLTGSLPMPMSQALGDSGFYDPQLKSYIQIIAPSCISGHIWGYFSGRSSRYLTRKRRGQK